MRAKLYGLFQKLGFGDAPGLTSDDYVTLSIIENYLDFKVSEIWNEIMCELEIEDVTPISPDQEALELIARGIEEKCLETVEGQKEIVGSDVENQLQDEQDFYTGIRERQKQRERAFKYYQDLIERTSKYHKLKEARTRQKSSIENSRISESYRSKPEFHETEQENTNVTTFCGRSINIDSTPQELTGGLLSKYDPKLGTMKSRKTKLEE